MTPITAGPHASWPAVRVRLGDARDLEFGQNLLDLQPLRPLAIGASGLLPLLPSSVTEESKGERAPPARKRRATEPATAPERDPAQRAAMAAARHERQSLTILELLQAHTGERVASEILERATGLSSRRVQKHVQSLRMRLPATISGSSQGGYCLVVPPPVRGPDPGTRQAWSLTLELAREEPSRLWIEGFEFQLDSDHAQALAVLMDNRARGIGVRKLASQLGTTFSQAHSLLDTLGEQLFLSIEVSTTAGHRLVAPGYDAYRMFAQMQFEEALATHMHLGLQCMQAQYP